MSPKNNIKNINVNINFQSQVHRGFDPESHSLATSQLAHMYCVLSAFILDRILRVAKFKFQISLGSK